MVKFDGPPTRKPPKGGGFVAMLAVGADGSEHGPWVFRVTPEAKARGVTVEGLKRRVEQYMETGE